MIKTRLLLGAAIAAIGTVPIARPDEVHIELREVFLPNPPVSEIFDRHVAAGGARLFWLDWNELFPDVDFDWALEPCS